jgi:hypothetical protein
LSLLLGELVRLLNCKAVGILLLADVHGDLVLRYFVHQEKNLKFTPYYGVKKLAPVVLGKNDGDGVKRE